MLLDGGLRIADTNANQIEKIAIWNPFNIKNYRRTVNAELNLTDHMRLVLSNRKGLQRVMIFFRRRCQSLWSAPRSESIGKLVDCEDSLLV
jgi:hypothetical protein